MKKYQCHKVVEAARINSCGFDEDGSGWVQYYETNGETIHIDLSAGFVRAGNIASPGDYLVRYQPDGYMSWSPKAVFEAGYTGIAEAADTWQARAVAELDELAARIHKLRVALLEGRPLAGQVTELMQAQLRAMDEYYSALHHRLSLVGAVAPIREGSSSARSKPAQLDIAKALRDAFAQGWHLARSCGDVGYTSKRDAWIRQYMARLPGVELVAQTGVATGDWSKLMGKPEHAPPTFIDGPNADKVSVVVTTPMGRRARVVISRSNGNSITQTVTEHQRQTFAVGGDEKIEIEEGQPHSTVAHRSE